jgi:hypothetical protein
MNPFLAAARSETLKRFRLTLINALLVERTIEREGGGSRLAAENLRALTPLFHGHVNPYCRARPHAGPSFLEGYVTGAMSRQADGQKLLSITAG